MGACCIYNDAGEISWDGWDCDDRPTAEGCAFRCDRWADCTHYTFVADSSCAEENAEHSGDYDWLNGCIRQLHVCCIRGGCLMTSEGACASQHGGAYNSSATSCDPDPCIAACCLPDGTCQNALTWWCQDQNGVVKWGQNCADNPCPEPPKPCCLCRGQCKMTSEGECSIVGGVWQETLPNCETASGQCGNINVKMRCRQSRFVMTKDILQDPTRYRPISRDTMDPHEYQRGVAGNNCRQWWGNVSVTKGAWGCGQWNKDDQSTLRNFKIHMKIDPVTGLGSRWAKYRPVCPEYT